MRRLGVLMIWIGIAGLIAAAQDAPQTKCPVLHMTGPAGVPNPEGSVIDFRATLGAEADNYALSFEWKVIGGEIVAGNETPVLKVKWPTPCKNSIHVSLKVGGLPDSCPSSFSETAAVACFPTASLIAEIRGRLPNRSDPRIAKVTHAFNGNLSAQIYVAISPRVTHRKKRDIFHLLRLEEEQRDRLTFVSGGKTQDFFAFWLVPAGASAPKP